MASLLLFLQLLFTLSILWLQQISPRLRFMSDDGTVFAEDEYDHKSLKQSLDVALLTPPVRSDGVDATPYLVAPLTRNTSITSLGTCASFEASASAYCLPSSASRTMHWDQLSWGATSISDSSDEEEAYSDAEGEEQESDGGPAEKDGEKGRNTKGERQSGVASTSTKDVKRTNSDSATATTPSYLPPWFNSVGSGDCRGIFSSFCYHLFFVPLHSCFVLLRCRPLMFVSRYSHRRGPDSNV